jgi:hypothetical protein
VATVLFVTKGGLLAPLSMSARWSMKRSPEFRQLSARGASSIAPRLRATAREIEQMECVAYGSTARFGTERAGLNRVPRQTSDALPCVPPMAQPRRGEAITVYATRSEGRIGASASWTSRIVGPPMSSEIAPSPLVQRHIRSPSRSGSHQPSDNPGWSRGSEAAGIIDPGLGEIE